jgi:hypothetical protein
VSETDTRLDMQPTLVRAAVELGFVHPVQHRAIDIALASGIKNAGNTAHI